MPVMLKQLGVDIQGAAGNQWKQLWGAFTSTGTGTVIVALRVRRSPRMSVLFIMSVLAYR